MKRSTIHQFYQRYFSATKNVSWLARQATAQRLEVLNFLMQWEVTKPTSEH
ncbi:MULTISPECIES: glucose uptake inhibitor SgrT [Kluyvera]|mgnify:FL=1|uniref:Glucose uptake inhibitor SgrT n=1 Tax=Kluyvera sichuanensis TaxID=2725494 RepID=A0ABR6RUX4_9ENTR|nr:MULTISPECIES: glucose uptake inhibitor SgrT [Kluyvera]MBC1186942.1 glucose uptake inhibitor SgrT [Kluyvera sichuanensis]MBW9463683.1 glucose uptake inhibitor SgrT [Kluyvera sp. EC_51]